MPVIWFYTFVWLFSRVGAISRICGTTFSDLFYLASVSVSVHFRLGCFLKRQYGDRLCHLVLIVLTFVDFDFVFRLGVDDRSGDAGRSGRGNCWMERANYFVLVFLQLTFGRSNLCFQLLFTNMCQFAPVHIEICP